MHVDPACISNQDRARCARPERVPGAPSSSRSRTGAGELDEPALDGDHGIAADAAGRTAQAAPAARGPRSNVSALRALGA